MPPGHLPGHGRVLLPTHVSALASSGTPLGFSQSGDMVSVRLSAGRHVLALEP